MGEYIFTGKTLGLGTHPGDPPWSWGPTLELVRVLQRPEGLGRTAPAP